MPTPLPAGLRLGAIEPRDAIEAFQQRKLLAPSFSWLDTWQDEHARSFAVAGVQRLDILQIFQQSIDKAITDGTSFNDYRNAVREQLVAQGWWGDIEISNKETGEVRTTRFDDRRLSLIFDVNLRQSQAAGRWSRIQRTKARFPFILYRTMQDERVRASHVPWNGLALPVDDVFWDTHFPPNGWRCRCTAFAVDQRDLDRRSARGEVIKTTRPPERLVNFINPRTGEIAAIPHGIDPGFAYNPGKARDQAAYDAMLRKAWAAHPLAAATAVAQAVRDRPAFIAERTQAFGEWAADVLTRKQLRGDLRFIGAMQPQIVRALRAADAMPVQAAIAVTDSDVLHAQRKSKDGRSQMAPLSIFLRLPELLERAEAVLIDESKGKPALLYVVDLVAADGKRVKLVVLLDMPTKIAIEGKRRDNVPINRVRTATVLSLEALKSEKNYRLVWGRLS
jgi:SPP1 gp7 family putative phage head morphogenesis protein